MDKGNFKTDEEIKREEFEKYSEYNIKKYTMASKLQEAARIYANTKNHSTGSLFSDCIDDYKAGAQWQQQQSKEVIEELVKALEEAANKLDDEGLNASKYFKITKKHRNNEKQG